MSYPTDFIEEDRSIPKKYRMTLLAIHHPNHFDGKWTLLAMCAKKDEREMFQNIVLSYPNQGILPSGDYSSLVSFHTKVFVSKTSMTFCLQVNNANNFSNRNKSKRAFWPKYLVGKSNHLIQV